MVDFDEFGKPEDWGQAELPVSFLIGQKWWEMPKLKNKKLDILSNFQTLCSG